MIFTPSGYATGCALTHHLPGLLITPKSCFPPMMKFKILCIGSQSGLTITTLRFNMTTLPCASRVWKPVKSWLASNPRIWLSTHCFYSKDILRKQWLHPTWLPLPFPNPSVATCINSQFNFFFKDSTKGCVPGQLALREEKEFVTLPRWLSTSVPALKELSTLPAQL